MRVIAGGGRTWGLPARGGVSSFTGSKSQTWRYLLSLGAMIRARVARLTPLELLLLPLLLGTRPHGERLPEWPAWDHSCRAVGTRRQQDVAGWGGARYSLGAISARVRPWAPVWQPAGEWTHPQSGMFRPRNLIVALLALCAPRRQPWPSAVLQCGALGNPELLLGSSEPPGDSTCAVSPESEVVSTLEWSGETEAQQVDTQA